MCDEAWQLETLSLVNNDGGRRVVSSSRNGTLIRRQALLAYQLGKAIDRPPQHIILWGPTAHPKLSQLHSQFNSLRVHLATSSQTYSTYADSRIYCEPT
jgi:hypothetical protein